MGPSIRRAWKTWAACLLLLTLVLGWGAEAIGDCDREQLGEVRSDLVCLHHEGGCEEPLPADAAHHHGAHCLCPCHELTIAPHALVSPELELVAFVNQVLPAGLTAVDLPSPLRPPIAG